MYYKDGLAVVKCKLLRMTEINQHQMITSSLEKTKSVTTPMGFVTTMHPPIKLF